MSKGWYVPATAALLLLALILRLAFAEYLVRADRFHLADTQLYLAYADRLAAGESYSLGATGDHAAKRAPGYPLFLAAVGWLTGSLPSDCSPRVFLFAQVLMATLAVAALARLAQQAESLGGWPAGSSVLATALFAVDPYACVMAGMLLSESLATSLLVFSAWLAAGSWNRLYPAVAGGGCLAAAVLVRPSLLLLAPLVAAGWLALRSNSQWRQVLAAGLGFVVVMAPWWIRNAAVFGTFVPTTLNVGESLYDGLHPGATGASDMRFANDPAVQAMSEQARDRHWRQAAIDWAVGHPTQAAWLAMVKLGRFWSPWPNESRFQQPVVMVITTLFTITCYAGVILGVAALWSRHRGLVVLCVLPALYLMSLHMFFVSSVRYRVPAMPFLELLASAGLAWGLKVCIRRSG